MKTTKWWKGVCLYWETTFRKVQPFQQLNLNFKDSKATSFSFYSIWLDKCTKNHKMSLMDSLTLHAVLPCLSIYFKIIKKDYHKMFIPTYTNLVNWICLNLRVKWWGHLLLNFWVFLSGWHLLKCLLLHIKIIFLILFLRKLLLRRISMRWSIKDQEFCWDWTLFWHYLRNLKRSCKECQNYLKLL